ncbi:hypothetical protein [Pseudomonas sp. Marseille-QA0332]
MRYLFVMYLVLGLGPLTAFAEGARTECLGRFKFTAPEHFEWATYNIGRKRIDKPGGHAFSEEIGAGFEYGSYAYDHLTVRVSDITTRRAFESTRRAIFGDIEQAKINLKEKLESHKRILESMRGRYSAEDMATQQARVERAKEDLATVGIYEHDLGIPDAHFLGSETTPFEFFLWRNNRVYYFFMDKPAKNSTERIKDLIARFEPRELYQVPKGPGVCFPYGFIHDDGKTGFSIKNSLRLASTPNVIMSMIHASPDDPTKPTRGLYNTHYYPGYDREKWRKSKILEKLQFGKRTTLLEGWRLDPRPGSGEQERAWFAVAHVGGLFRSLMAVHMHTFPQGTDGLKTLTPPPEEVIPKFQAITRSIREF